MSEQIGWILVIAVAVAIAGVFVLSRELEKNLRETIEFMIRSNDMIVAHFESRTCHTPDVQEERLVGMVLERRHGERRDRHNRSNPRISLGQRRAPGRRSGDLHAVTEA